jgi:hypothetical protein
MKRAWEWDSLPDATHIHQEFSRNGSVVTHGDRRMGVVRLLADRDKRGRFM